MLKKRRKKRPDILTARKSHFLHNYQTLLPMIHFLSMLPGLVGSIYVDSYRIGLRSLRESMLYSA
jgi:hypothetical protein